MAETPTQTAVLLIAHGSRHQPANDDLHAMAARFSAQGEHTIVEACFLELAEPDIATGGSRYAARGATRVLLVPYLLSAGVQGRERGVVTEVELSKNNLNILPQFLGAIV